jgi:hypothetical protein
LALAARPGAAYFSDAFLAEGHMTDFRDRQRGEEAKFAMDEETAFKVAARRNRLLGDLTAAEADVSEADIRAKLEEKAVEARRQLMSDS